MLCSTVGCTEQACYYWHGVKLDGVVDPTVVKLVGLRCVETLLDRGIPKEELWSLKDRTSTS